MSEDMIMLLFKALGETVYMVAVSMLIATIIGVPLGVLLHTTEKGGVLAAPVLNKAISSVVNAVRSIPFIILMVAIIPFTRLIVGSAIGTTAAMVPLTLASIPFIGRQVETSLREVPYGIIEAALAMGQNAGNLDKSRVKYLLVENKGLEPLTPCVQGRCSKPTELIPPLTPS